MRNKPLPGLAKYSSPLHKKTKTYSTQADDPNKKMGFYKTMKKLKPIEPIATLVPKPTGGFMNPPYRYPAGPTEKAKGYHGYKSK